MRVLPIDEPTANPLCSDDPQAWERLVDAVGPASMLVAIERRMSPALRARLGAEDLWQETLLCAWRDRHQFTWRGLTSFRRWLLQVAEHRLCHHIEAQHAQKRGGGTANVPFTESTADRAALDTATPSRSAVDRELAANLTATLAALPEELREVVFLRLFEGLELEVIGARLQLTLAAVRHRLRRGGELFRTRLGKLAGSSWRTRDSATARGESPAG